MRFLRNIWQRLSVRFNPNTLEEQAAELAGNAIVALVKFLVFLVLVQAIKSVLPWLLGRFGPDETSRSLANTIVRLVVLTIGAVAALGELRVNTPVLVTSMGIAGLTIDFAARDALFNVVSGLFIFWDRPFVPGDLIDSQRACVRGSAGCGSGSAGRDVRRAAGRGPRCTPTDRSVVMRNICHARIAGVPGGPM